MAVILEPCGEAVLIADFPQTAYIIIGDLVGHKPADIPEEPVRHLTASDNHPAEHGNIRSRIIAIDFLEIRDHVVGPILAAGLIAVLHDNLESLPVLSGDPLQDLSEIVVEMVSDVLLAHLVGLKASAFLGSRRIHRSGRKHRCPLDNPLTSRDIP